MTLPSPRRLWISGACLSLLLAIHFCGSHYADWKTARLRQSAKRAIEQQKPTEAALDAAAALQLRPGDHELTRLLGDAYDANNDERLLTVLLQQISQRPEALDPRLRLARAALRFGRLDLSAKAIDEMPHGARSTTDYHQISSALATVTKDGQRLLDHARELHRLEPDNAQHLLKLGGLAIVAESLILRPSELNALRDLADRADDQEAATSASVLLWGLSRLPDFNPDDAAELDAKLLPALARDGVGIHTRLQALDLAVATKAEETAQAILKLMMDQAAAKLAEDEIGLLVAWMNKRRQSGEALAWARQLGLLRGAVKPTPSLASVLAETCASGGAWTELEWLVTGTDWGRGEFIRNFYAAKCAVERPGPSSEIKRESFLRLALKESQTHPAQLQLLWNLARKFGWRDLAQPLSWALAERTQTMPERRSILQSISADALSEGDLAGFHRVTTELLKLSPGQWELRNNEYYAQLLQGGCDDSLLEEIAAFHAEFKSQADVSTTYAFALHLAGHHQRACATLDQLDGSLRESPGIAPFCALIYQAGGESAKADKYRALPHQLYFPEEQDLLAQLAN